MASLDDGVLPVRHNKPFLCQVAFAMALSQPQKRKAEHKLQNKTKSYLFEVIKIIPL